VSWESTVIVGCALYETRRWDGQALYSAWTP